MTTTPAAATRRQWVAWVVFIPSTVMLLASVPFILWAFRRHPGAGSGDSLVGAIGANLMFLALPVVGMLIARRHPDNRIAWILLGIGAVVGLGALTAPYSTYGLVINPGSLPGAPLVTAIDGSLWVPAIGLTGTYLILLFPDGHLPSPRWRPVAWASGITMGVITATFVFAPRDFEQAPGVSNPLGIGVLRPVLSVVVAAIPVLPLCMFACAVSLVLRFRRSKGVERQQVKWLASAAALVASVYLLAILISSFYNVSGRPSPPWLDALSNASVLTFVLIPVAIGVAVLKHGLYGIDRLISRTVTYALITGTLLVVYVSLVTAVSRLTPGNSSAAVAASTLAVAALFQPLRRRVQSVVDRRFNRARYDADRTVEAFTRTLREEVDLDAVSSDLIAAVHDTLEPARVGLWLRDVT